jgi:16S rRNA (uracil1498-N3)-methyltransferase
VPYFFVGPEGDRVTLTGDDAAHLTRSLRARPGELINAVDPGDGREGRLLTIRLVSVSPREVAGVIEEARPHRPEPLARITIGLALLPAAALEQALTHCTELGADGFVLIRARRSVARVDPGAKSARWEAVCHEAAMLAGRLRVPAVRGPVGFGQVTAGGEEVLLLDRQAPRRLADLHEPRDLTVLVGPEGGWAPEEISWARGRTATLGPRNLRAEHAAATALAVALAARSDL